jgi:hypothetical protein
VFSHRVYNLSCENIAQEWVKEQKPISFQMQRSQDNSHVKNKSNIPISGTNFLNVIAGDTALGLKGYTTF